MGEKNYVTPGGSNTDITVDKNKRRVMICLPKKPNVKTLNAPLGLQPDLRDVAFKGLGGNDLCIECKTPMSCFDHFK